MNLCIHKLYIKKPKYGKKIELDGTAYILGPKKKEQSEVNSLCTIGTSLYRGVASPTIRHRDQKWHRMLPSGTGIGWMEWQSRCTSRNRVTPYGLRGTEPGVFETFNSYAVGQV